MNDLRLIGLIFVLGMVVMDPSPGQVASSSTGEEPFRAPSGGEFLHRVGSLSTSPRPGPRDRYEMLIRRAAAEPKRFWDYIRVASRLEPALFGSGSKKKSCSPGHPVDPTDVIHPSGS